MATLAVDYTDSWPDASTALPAGVLADTSSSGMHVTYSPWLLVLTVANRSGYPAIWYL
jgi:hypothetical protein